MLFTPPLIEELRTLGAATLLEGHGQQGALHSGIKPIDPTLRLAGPALTVECQPGDNLMLHYAVTLARPGDVLVVDAKGFEEGGHWGDILTLAAQKAGIAGLVIDGAVRDADAIIRMKFPVFARGLSINSPQKIAAGRVNVPIQCGGVKIEPGDFVVGDRDGVVAIRAANLSATIAAGRKREEREDYLRREIEQGKTTVQLFELEEKLASMGFTPIPPRS